MTCSSPFIDFWELFIIGQSAVTDVLYFQLGLAPLPDNDPRDKYYYEIFVSTGMRRNAGTESKV